MTEDEARRAILVRAIEEEDQAGDLLTKQDRAHAHEAGRAALTGTSRKDDDLFLARRAEFAVGRLASRHPAIEQTLRRSRWPKWIDWAVPLAAFIFGVALNELDNGRRLDLLAFPLLGMLAWNAAVYFWMLVTLVPRAGSNTTTGLARLIEKAASFGRRSFDRATPVARGLGGFAKAWGAASAAIAAARSARILHLGAAMFALGVVAGIFIRALGVEYRAGWESTFLEPPAVEALINLMLGPASAVTGLALPDIAGITAMRWTGAETGGVNAAPWIILTTATVIGFVVIPRLIFAGLAALRAARKRRNFALPGRKEFYYRRLLRGAHGTAGSVRVTPYAYHPDEPVREALRALVQDALGDGAVVRFDPPVEYGAEDNWLASAEFSPDDDHHLLLFTLSATPEHENHGILAQQLRDTLAAKHPGTLFGVIVDEGAFRARFAGQSAMAGRLATRGEAWEQVMSRAGTTPLLIDLSGSEQQAAPRIEALLTGTKQPEKMTA